MAEVYGTGAVAYSARSAAQTAAMANPIDALKQLAVGGSIGLSGADYAETVQHLNSLAILYIADKLNV